MTIMSYHNLGVVPGLTASVIENQKWAHSHGNHVLLLQLGCDALRRVVAGQEVDTMLKR
jgi:hypothetical protein